MTNQLDKEYERVCNTLGDIVEHLPTLCSYAKQCDRILELGISICISTWAFLQGLSYEKRVGAKKLIGCDTKYHPNMEYVKSVAEQNHIEYTYHIQSDLTLDMAEIGEVDMTFIDTWHIYGQLKRELENFAPYTKKYLIMHDTEIDGIHGESIRDSHTIIQLSKTTGIPIREIVKGLWYAIDEFLGDHPEWIIDIVKKNNNGLTVLKRV